MGFEACGDSFDRDQQYRRIARQDYFRGLEKADFVDNLADVWGEIKTGGSALLEQELLDPGSPQ